MPDHLHLFCSPGFYEAPPLSRWIRYWKSWASVRWPFPAERPIWQDNYWDRQLRSNDHYSTRWHYVKNNPVRHGLVSHSDDWPFQGELTPLRLR